MKKQKPLEKFQVPKVNSDLKLFVPFTETVPGIRRRSKVFKTRFGAKRLQQP